MGGVRQPRQGAMTEHERLHAASRVQAETRGGLLRGFAQCPYVLEACHNLAKLLSHASRLGGFSQTCRHGQIAAAGPDPDGV